MGLTKYIPEVTAWGDYPHKYIQKYNWGSSDKWEKDLNKSIDEKL